MEGIMGKGKRCLAVLLIFSLTLSLCGCDKEKNNGVNVTDSLDGKDSLVGNIPCEFPLVSEKTTLNFLSFRSCDTEFDDIYVWNKYEEMTGVDINWTTTSRHEREEAVYTALMNKTDVDLIMRCKIPSSTLYQYGKNGLILDLNKDDMLKNYAPNCWAYLQSHPTTLASVINPDGSIYALPQVNSGAELRVSVKMYINKEWLERVHMNVPTTTEELYEVLKAFRDNDANGNGDPEDEIPMSPQDWINLRYGLSGAFGIMNRGYHNTTIDCDESTGKVRLTAASDEYKSFLEYCNRLYEEGLIDSNIFSMTKEEWNNNAINDRIGVYLSTNLSAFPADKVDNWVGINEALEGPDGVKEWNAIRADFHSTGNAIIPSTCKNPELVLKWLDYFWTDEGTLFYHMGIEGETFVANDDGTYNYVDDIYNEIKESNASFDEIVSKYTPYPGGGNPTVEIAPYFMGGEMADVPATTARALFEYGPREYWPSFTFTDDENERLSLISSDINKYCDGMQQEFVTGTTSLDDWDDYISQMDSFEVDEYLSIYQSALERYENMETSSK